MIKGKVVIVTGASSGIGKSLAVEFAREGASVVLAARDLEMLEKVASEIHEFNSQTLIVKTDISIESDCKNLIQKTIEKFGRIDILVNNAAISMRSLFKDVDLEVLRRVMDVNFWGVVYCSKYALPYVLESKGSIVGVLSTAAFKGLPGRIGYTSSKFAVHGFLEVLRIENRKTGLHVLVAAPGFTKSNIRVRALTSNGTPQGESPRTESKLMSPERVALRIIRAVKMRKLYCIMSFEGIMIPWLNKFSRKFVDKLVYDNFAKEIDSPFK